MDLRRSWFADRCGDYHRRVGRFLGSSHAPRRNRWEVVFGVVVAVGVVDAGVNADDPDADVGVGVAVCRGDRSAPVADRVPRRSIGLVRALGCRRPSAPARELCAVVDRRAPHAQSTASSSSASASSSSVSSSSSASSSSASSSVSSSASASLAPALCSDAAAGAPSRQQPMASAVPPQRAERTVHGSSAPDTAGTPGCAS